MEFRDADAAEEEQFRYEKELKYEDIEAFRQVILDSCEGLPAGGHIVPGIMLFVVSAHMKRAPWFGCRIIDWWHMWRISEWQHRQSKTLLTEAGKLKIARMHTWGDGRPLVLYSTLPDPPKPVQGENVYLWEGGE